MNLAVQMLRGFRAGRVQQATATAMQEKADTVMFADHALLSQHGPCTTCFVYLTGGICIMLYAAPLPWALCEVFPWQYARFLE